VNVNVRQNAGLVVLEEHVPRSSDFPACFGLDDWENKQTTQLSNGKHWMVPWSFSGATGCFQSDRHSVLFALPAILRKDVSNFVFTNKTLGQLVFSETTE
jgi:hypothetical protein